MTPPVEKSEPPVRPPMRVHVVDYLNARPLTWGLVDHEELAPRWGPPAEGAGLLAQGEVDVALLSVAALGQAPGARFVPGWGVACRGAAESVLLIAEVPWSRVERVALDASSRTSVELARLVLAWRGIEPAWSTRPPNLEAMLGEADAALLIGDPALCADTSGLHVLDLGEEWTRRTGLPFVFAAWAAAPGIEAGPWIDALERCAREGTARLDRIAEEGAERLGLDRQRLEAYLHGALHYRLGEEEREGLRLFFRLLGEAGRVDPGLIPRFLATSPAGRPVEGDAP